MKMTLNKAVSLGWSVSIWPHYEGYTAVFTKLGRTERIGRGATVKKATRNAFKGTLWAFSSAVRSSCSSASWLALSLALPMPSGNTRLRGPNGNRTNRVRGRFAIRNHPRLLGSWWRTSGKGPPSWLTRMPFGIQSLASAKTVWPLTGIGLAICRSPPARSFSTRKNPARKAREVSERP